MLARWGRAASQLTAAAELTRRVAAPRAAYLSDRSYSKVGTAAAAGSAAATVTAPSTPAVPSPSKRPLNKPEVRLNVMFWSKACSLALPPNSPLRLEEPHYEVFQLEKTFKTTFSLLVLHMWLFLRRLKEEGKEGVEFGQYLYEIYNHDLELRVSKAGVNLLLTKWMKDLEKIFYGNIVAYDAAMTPEAKHDDLANVIWRNIFSDDGSVLSNDAAATAAAMARYTRRESTCLSLTDKEAIFSGNFMFTLLENKPNPGKMTNLASCSTVR
ncbi:Ubiquinol-cytochrome C chaperone [Musa troglodytarum]|uniref:Ubiquinol-cytochrome C chaperone n=1 Tax=Musa troglodytarum TaxID=320322 RepID=A0A9E7H869_9LILI|nr:Ubiquinol-cytochrome C chaperone [Musa troglodytarum]